MKPRQDAPELHRGSGAELGRDVVAGAVIGHRSSHVIPRPTADADHKDRRRRLRSLAGWLTLAGLFGFLAAPVPGIRHSNEGSHYALVRSLSDGTAVIDPYFSYTAGVDYSQRKGHFYSDRPPGTAVLALPLYTLGRFLGGRDAAQRAWMGGAGPDDPARLDVPPVEEYTTSLLSPASGVAVLLLSFVLARELGAGRRESWAVAAAALLGTMVWRYSTILFSHAAATALLLGLVVLALRADRNTGSRYLVALGLVGGVATAVEYSAAVPAVLLSAVVLFRRARRAQWRNFGDVAALAAGAVLPLVLLASYHWWAFGSPFATSHSFKGRPEFAFTRSISGLLSGPITNLFPMLGHPSKGILTGNPLLLLCPIGLVAIFRQKETRLAAQLILVTTVPLLILQAKFPTWEGGRTADSRFATILLPLLVVPLAVFLTRHRQTGARPSWVCVGVGVVGLAVAGFVLQATRLVLFLGHFERLTGGPAIRNDTAFHLGHALENWVRAALPSLRYLPATLAVAALLAIGGHLFCMRASTRPTSSAKAGAVDSSIRGSDRYGPGRGQPTPY